MNNKGRKLLVLGFFLSSIVLAYYTSHSLIAIPLVFIFWLLLFIVIFNVVIFQLQVFRSRKYTLKLLHDPVKGKLITLVVSFNEDPKMLYKTLISVKISNPSGETWLLDDSTDQRIVNELESICDKLGVKFVHRNTRRGYKAGALNDALKIMGDEFEFMAVFDSDQMPSITFFDGIMGYFKDEKVAAVQTPQTYTNISTNISSAASSQQELFLRRIMPSRSESSAFILGSGFVARVSAIKSIGGFYEASITEDLATSLILESNGWKIVYVDTLKIWYGRAPETVCSYLRQQGRWSFGGFQAFRLILNSKLSLSAFFDYFSGWLYWLWIGPIRLFALLPLILFLDFRFVTVLINPVFFIIFYFPFFIYTIFFYFYVTSDDLTNYGKKGFILHQGAELLAMIPVTSSFFSYIFRKNRPFTVTKKGVGPTSRYRVGIPTYSIDLIVAVSIIMGLLWLRTANSLLLRVAILVNLFFAFYLILFLAAATLILVTNNFKPD